MPKFFKESENRSITNGGTAFNCGDLVQVADGTAAIVEAQRGLPANEIGSVRIKGQVICNKTVAATAITAGDRVEYVIATKTVAAKVGAATAGAFIIGRAVATAAANVATVIVDLNHQGPTI